MPRSIIHGQIPFLVHGIWGFFNQNIYYNPSGPVVDLFEGVIAHVQQPDIECGQITIVQADKPFNPASCEPPAFFPLRPTFESAAEPFTVLDEHVVFILILEKVVGIEVGRISRCQDRSRLKLSILEKFKKLLIILVIRTIIAICGIQFSNVELEDIINNGIYTINLLFMRTHVFGICISKISEKMLFGFQIPDCPGVKRNLLKAARHACRQEHRCNRQQQKNRNPNPPHSH